jgi:hypothetical protein
LTLQLAAISVAQTTIARKLLSRSQLLSHNGIVRNRKVNELVTEKLCSAVHAGIYERATEGNNDAVKKTTTSIYKLVARFREAISDMASIDSLARILGGGYRLMRKSVMRKISTQNRWRQ